MLRRGPLSNEEKKFIQDNHKRMTVAEIAKSCSRSIEPIKKYIVENNLSTFRIDDNNDRQLIRKRLENEYFWPSVLRALDDDEVDFFISAWIEYMEQFNEDMTTSEKAQTKQLILFEITKNRASLALRKALNRIEEVDELIQKELLKTKSTRDEAQIESWRIELNLSKAELQSYDSQIEKINKSCQDLYRDLKSTRDQRFKQVESGQTTFQAIIKELLDAKKREEKGRSLELLKLGADKSANDLSTYHQYADGQLDIPILNAENYMKSLEEDNNE